jgi:LacI family transcriptional regulator
LHKTFFWSNELAVSVSSLKDVAQAANVSVPTASRILRKKNLSRFSEETRNKVWQAAERLRYRPNMLVKGIQTGLTHTIGVMVPPFDSYWSSILYGIHDTLITVDFVPINLWVRHGDNFASSGPVDDLEQIHRLIDRRIDGVIMWPPITPDFYAHNEELASRNVPVVTIDHELPTEFGANSVTTNEEHGAHLVAKHLLDLGHRRIAHLGDVGLETYSWAQRRRKFFENEINAVEGASCFAVEKPKNSDGLEIAKRILTADPRPTAVYAASDSLARYIYLAAAELKLRIPEDVSVVGFADLDFAAFMMPPLTSVRQKGYEVGRRAAKLLINRIQGKFAQDGIQNIVMNCELVVRGSTAPVQSV